MIRSARAARLLVLFFGAGALSSTLAAQSATAAQRAAVQRACQNGALSAEECQAKTAALNGTAGQAGAPNGSQAGAQAQGGTQTPDPNPARAGAGTPAGGRDIAGATVWRHPQGLYSISVPPGWQVDTSQSAPKLVNGETWATLETSASSSEPMQVSQRNADQMKGMLGDWHVTDQGSFSTRHGHPAAGITASCMLPTRSGQQPRVMMFVTQTDGQHHFVAMTGSTPAQNAQQTGLVLMQVVNSLRFAGE